MRRYAVLVIGFLAAVLFIRLGFWQLSRRAERREHNQLLAARLALPILVISPDAWLRPGDIDRVRYRRATAAGRFDFGRQMVEIGRSLNGVPGVHVLTPLLLGGDRAVLVDRGWTYAADGTTVDRAAVAEPDSAVVEGVLSLPGGRFAVQPDTLRLGYALLPLVLRRVAPGPGMPAALRAVPLPPPSDGPHLSYAVQWFSFAAIALVGSMLLARREERR
jgi:surfeit locus 1 family protein